MWQKNIAALKKHHPEILKQVLNHTPCPVGQIIRTENNMANLVFSSPGTPQILAYNQKDPWVDAAEHLKTARPGFSGLAVFVGLGLGYGALLVLRECQKISRIIIIEPDLNLFITALNTVDLSSLFTSEKTVFFVGPLDHEEFKAKSETFATLSDTIILCHHQSFRWSNIYDKTLKEIYGIVSLFNIAGGTTTELGIFFLENRLQNLTLIRKCSLLGELKDSFKSKPMILVASGPSLTHSIPYLKEAQKKYILVAADGALAPLLYHDIIPDFVTVFDPIAKTFEKLAPFINQDHKFSIISPFKVNPLIPKRFPVKKIFFASEDDLPQFWINQTLQTAEIIPDSSSVAHLSLGFAIITGADPIILVGQDLAYQETGNQHAKGVINARAAQPTDTFPVMGVDGKEVNTSRNFLEIRNRMEEIIKQYPGRYINCTASGAHITGTEVIPFEQVLKTIPASKDGQQIYPSTFAKGENNEQLALRLRKKANKTLTEINRAEKILLKFKRSGKKLYTFLTQEKQKKKQIAGEEQLPGPLKKELKNLRDLQEKLNRQKDLWEQVAELTFNSNLESTQRKEKNQQIFKNQGFLSWLINEMDRTIFIAETKENALNKYSPVLEKFLSCLSEEELLLKSIAKHDNPFSYQVKLIDLYLDNENYLFARDMLDQLSPLEREKPEITARQGIIFLNLLKFDQAELFLKKAVKKSPELKIFIEKEKSKAANTWLKQMEENKSQRPKLFAPWLERVLFLMDTSGITYMELKRLWEKEAESLEKDLAANQLKRPANTLLAWEQAKDIFPLWYMFHSKLSAASGSFERALADINKALKLEPDNGQWLAQKARILLESGQFDQGLETLQRATALDPSTALLWEELGDAVLESNDYQSAIFSYHHCIQAIPEKSDLYLKIAQCYIKTGQYQDALNSYGDLLKINPSDQHALEGIKNIPRLVPVKAINPDPQHPAAEKKLNESPIYLGLCSGENYGWGVCSKYLSKELAQKTKIRILNSEDGTSTDQKLPGKLFQCLTNIDFPPLFPKARGIENYAYTFFEGELNQKSIENSKQYKTVMAGSSWCEKRMREKGINNCSLLIQGIDPEIFHPINKSRNGDNFVLFSGGKFEYRKGQDIVLKAVKILQEKYNDIVLVNCWYNIWPETMDFMKLSPHIKYENKGRTWEEKMSKIYQINNLDPTRIKTLPIINSQELRDLYATTDLGIFPNRCEGGTNLVLMEYMACAKPVIASNTSGHTDIITRENSLRLENLKDFTIFNPDDSLGARWQEPSVDELVAKIEYAYQNREKIQDLGKQAGQDLKHFTWEKSAKQLLSVINA
jgi:glycosyltransferase involved in cell wall biosynthesis/thioredoxin-like negative regulator of GroEL